MKLPLYILKILLSAFCIILIPTISYGGNDASNFEQASKEFDFKRTVAKAEAAKAAADDKAAKAAEFGQFSKEAKNNEISAELAADDKAAKAAECDPTEMPVVNKRCNENFAEMATKKCMNKHKMGMLGMQTAGMVVQVTAISSGESESASNASKAVGATNIALGGLNTKVAVSCLNATIQCKKICTKKIAACKEKVRNSNDEGYTAALKLAKKTRDICETLSDTGIAAAAQAAVNATQAALAYLAASALDPGDEKPPANDIAPPQVPNLGSSEFPHNPNPFSTSSLSTDGANLAGNFDNPAPNALPYENKPPDTSGSFAGNQEDSEGDDSAVSSNSPTNSGLDYGTGISYPNPNETTDNNDKGSFRKNSFIGKFTGGRRSSSDSNYNNEDSSSRRGGRLKLARRSKKTASNSKNLKRRLSSSSGKHKSIFEHMSTLITSYCIEGSTNCH